MPAAIDMTGLRYGRLVAIRLLSTQNKQRVWLFKCDCGKYTRAQGCNVRYGDIKSCGCLRNEVTGNRSRTHGRSKTPEWNIWCAMRDRCSNPKARAFRFYGARGIRVCRRWQQFSNFYADMGPRPSPAHSIDRKNPFRGYYKSNCRWATDAEQGQTRRTLRRFNFKGKKHTLKELETLTGIPVRVLYDRIHVLHWPIKLALCTPKLSNGIKKRSLTLYTT